MHDHDTNFYDFVALHAATIKKYKLKNYVIGTEVNQNFGRTYIRIVAFSVRNENVHISYGGNCGYFSTTINQKIDLSILKIKMKDMTLQSVFKEPLMRSVTI